MKRIISMVMSILMIMTMFCGVLSVGSVADETFDNAETLMNITLEAGEIQEDGTFTVSVWVQDTTPYGFFSLSFIPTWDGKVIAPLNVDPVIDWTIEDYTDRAYWDLAEANNMMSQLHSQYDDGPLKQRYKTRAAVVTETGEHEETGGMYSIGHEIGIAISNTTGYPNAFGYNSSFKTDYVFDTTTFTYDDVKGALWATATFKVIDGASGSTTISASVKQATFAPELKSQESVEDLDRVSVTSDTINLGGEEEPEASALPDGMTITVDKTASVRTTNDYEGIRFTTSVTVTDTEVWNEVAEMGTAIVVSGSTPTAEGFGDTTLKIPARVEYHEGKYIQERVDNADGTLTFTDGLLADAKAGTEIKFSGVISKVANYNMEFDAYAYVKLTDGTVVFSDNYHTSSMQAVCEAAIGDTEVDNYTEYQAKVQALIDKYPAA